MTAPVIALIISGAGGVETVHDEFVVPAVERGWVVAVTATPTAGRWLGESGSGSRIGVTTGLPVRVEPGLPAEASPRPRPTCVVVAPATANTVSKLALGLADNQALTVAGQALGEPDVPVIVFPRINAAHARHPLWTSHLAVLESAGAHVVQGEELWPLHEPGRAPVDRPLPWRHILDLVVASLPDPRAVPANPDSLYGRPCGARRGIRP